MTDREAERIRGVLKKILESMVELSFNEEDKLVDSIEAQIEAQIITDEEWDKKHGERI